MTSTGPTVVDVDVNPADDDQRYILWSNGYIQAYGGAPAITSGPNWFDRTDQPVGVAFHITDWATGKGYVLDYTGKFWPLNGASAMGTNGYVSGVPQATDRTYCDWAWDPANPTRGAVLDVWGQLYAFGGLAACPRPGRRWSHPRAKRCRMRFTPDVRCITLDMHGGLHGDWNSGGWDDDDRWPGWDAGRDFCVTDWDNHKGYVLDLYGGHSGFGGAKTVYGYRYKDGVDCGRRHHCLDPVTLKFWVIWDGGIEYEFTAAQPPTVAAGGGTNEQQRVTITGSPTGGSFRLTYSGQQTSTLSWNATGDQVQAALEALSNIAVGDVEAWGNPGGPYTVEFTGSLGSTNVAQMTVSSTFTGGSSPTAVVTTLTTGSGQLSPSATVTSTTRPTLSWTYGDPDHSAQNAWQLLVFTQAFADAHDMSDPWDWSSSATATATGHQPSQRGVVLAQDFDNGDYRMFVRVQNKIGLWSSWSSCDWVQNVPPPPHPTGLFALADNDSFAVNLTCHCTIDGTADYVIFEYSDDGGDTWNAVRGAEAVPISTTTLAADRDIPLGITRQYRSYVYKASPRYISTLSNVASASVSSLRYVLTSVDDASLGGEITVVDAPQFTRNAKAGVFEGIGAQYPVVVSDGVPKARRETVAVEVNSAAEWATLKALLESDSTLIYRNPFGEVVYCRLVGDWSRTQIRRFPQPGEVTPLMHSHKVSIPLVEVEPPLLLDVGYTLPPGPTGPQ